MSDLIKQCDECRLNECINCEHSWADIQEIKKQLAEKDKEINRLSNKPIIETNRETGTMKIDNIEFNVEQTKAISHLLEAFEKKVTEDVCNKILELCDKKFRSINEFDFVEVISRDELIEVLDYIEGAE